MNTTVTLKHQTIHLNAPISGTTLPLSAVLDPLISQGVLGHGIAIEPISSRIVAPCHGTITELAPTGHQLSLTTEHGVVITIIIGHDAIRTHGLGFSKKVTCGDIVIAGQTLIELDTLKLKAQLQSLAVSILITKGALKLKHHFGIKRAGEDKLLSIVIKDHQ